MGRDKPIKHVRVLNQEDEEEPFNEAYEIYTKSGLRTVLDRK